MIVIASVIVLLLLCGLVLLLLGGRLREYTGLPGGAVLFSDTGYERIAVSSMVSHRLGLVGKPDFLIKVREGVVPVECKSGKMPAAGPYFNHQMQLGAYLLLVEEFYGRVAFGVLKYANGSVRVEYTRELREKVLRLLGEMRALENADLTQVRRSHNSVGRCRGCGYLSCCDEAIA